MKTKIKHISEDQNTITHESGFQTVFKEDFTGICFGCVYYKLHNIDCGQIPCDYNKRTGRRNDTKTGIFIEKNSVD